jgi:hypothetical protein
MKDRKMETKIKAIAQIEAAANQAIEAMAPMRGLIIFDEAIADLRTALREVLAHIAAQDKMILQQSELVEKCMKEINHNADLGQKAEAEIVRLRAAGGELSNCAFNLSQTAGKVLTERSVNTLKLAYKNWDAALTPTKEPS